MKLKLFFLTSIRNVEQGQKADIYQLGLLLLEVITGKPAQSKNQLDFIKSLVSSFIFLQKHI
jgi:hypothetical protein